MPEVLLHQPEDILATPTPLAKRLLRHADALLDQLPQLRVHVDRARQELRPALEDRGAQQLVGFKDRPPGSSGANSRSVERADRPSMLREELWLDLHERREHRHAPAYRQPGRSP